MFASDKKSQQLIKKIGERTYKLLKFKEDKVPPKQRKQFYSLDVSAAMIFCNIDLKKLYEFSDFDFIHDITSINKNLNRNTYKLENCFFPRSAK